MADWGVAGVLFVVFLVMLVTGLVVAAWTLTRPVPSGRAATAILDERLARGQISPEEYRGRREVLGTGKSGVARRHLGILAAVLVVAGLVGTLSAAAAGNDFGDTGFFDMQGMMGRGSRSADTAPAPIPGARQIRVMAHEFRFEPSKIRIRAGERVNLELDNRGDDFHTLTISNLDFELRADGHKRDKGSLTVDQPGRYRFICDVPGHEAAGMRGTLIVEDGESKR